MILWSLWVIGEGDGNVYSVIEMVDYIVIDWIRVVNFLVMMRVGIVFEFFILRVNSLESGVLYIVRVEGKFDEVIFVLKFLLIFFNFCFRLIW